MAKQHVKDVVLTELQVEGLLQGAASIEILPEGETLVLYIGKVRMKVFVLYTDALNHAIHLINEHM